MANEFRIGVEWRDVTSITPYIQNTKKHPTEQIDRLAGSIAEFGWDQPIVVDGDGVIIKGHGRREAALRLGLKEVPVVVRTDLSPAQVKAARIADNKVAESEWDVGALTLELQDLDGELDLGLLGFEPDELAALLNPEQPPEEGLTDPDAVPEVAETRCKPGDLWILGEHRLLCGDSTNVQHVERLMAGERADMVFTDPPYSKDYASRGAKDECEKVGSFGDILQAVASAVSEVRGAWYVKLPWYDAVPAIPLLAPSNFIVWAKRGFGMGGGDFRTQHEVLLYGRKDGVCHAGKDIGDVWEFPVPFRGRMLHVAETPVALIEQAIGFSSDPGALVQELFLGSGTTLIASERLGRRCFGLEISPAYCDVILARWEAFTGKQATLAPAEETVGP